MVSFVRAKSIHLYTKNFNELRQQLDSYIFAKILTFREEKDKIRKIKGL